MGNSKSVETVKAESFQQEPIRDDSMFLVNLHLPSSFGGGMVIIVILGLACLGYGAARLWDRKKAAARRASTTLKIAKKSPVKRRNPVWGEQAFTGGKTLAR